MEISQVYELLYPEKLKEKFKNVKLQSKFIINQYQAQYSNNDNTNFSSYIILIHLFLPMY